MTIREMIEALFGATVTDVLEADGIDETVESPELLAREAAGSLLEDYGDEALHVCLCENGFAIVGSSQAIWLGDDSSVEVKELEQESDDDSDDSDDDDLDEDELDERKRRRMPSGQKAKMLRSRKTQTASEKKKNIKRRKTYKRTRLKTARLRKRVTSSDDQEYFLVDAITDDEDFLNYLTDEQVEEVMIDDQDTGCWAIPADLLDAEEIEESEEDPIDEALPFNPPKQADTLGPIISAFGNPKYYYLKDDLQGYKGKDGKVYWYEHAGQGVYKLKKTTSNTSGAEKKRLGESTDTVIAFHKSAARDFLRLINKVKLDETPSIATRNDYMYAAIPSSVAESMSLFFEADYLELNKTKEEALYELVSEAVEEGLEENSDTVSLLLETPWVTRKMALQANRVLISSGALTVVEGKMQLDEDMLPKHSSPQPKIPYDVGPGSTAHGNPTFSQEPGAPKVRKQPESTDARMLDYLSEDMLRKMSSPQKAKLKDATISDLKALGKLLQGKTDAQCRSLLVRCLGEEEDLDEKTMPHVGQEVKGKTGKKWTSGKITKVNKDGSYEYKDSATGEIKKVLKESEEDLEEGFNEPGKRDGTGPYKNSFQKKNAGKGKRKAAGEKCPVTDEELEEATNLLKDEDLKGLKKWAGDYKTAMTHSNKKMAAGIKSNVDKRLKTLGIADAQMRGAYKLIGMVESEDDLDESPQKHACENCDNFSTSGGFMNCNKSGEVMAKHGGDSLEKWCVDNSGSKNACSIFKKLVQEGELDESLEQEMLKVMNAVDKQHKKQDMDEGDYILRPASNYKGASADEIYKALRHGTNDLKNARKLADKLIKANVDKKTVNSMYNKLQMKFDSVEGDFSTLQEEEDEAGEEDTDTAKTTLTCSKAEVHGFIKALRACGATDDAKVVIEGDEVKIIVTEEVAEKVKSLLEG